MRTSEFIEMIEDLFGKELLITFTDGQKVSGTLFNYVSALDNEPEGEAIDIWQTRKIGFEGSPMEIEMSEIQSVEII